MESGLLLLLLLLLYDDDSILHHNKIPEIDYMQNIHYSSAVQLYRWFSLH